MLQQDQSEAARRSRICQPPWMQGSWGSGGREGRGFRNRLAGELEEIAPKLHYGGHGKKHTVQTSCCDDVFLNNQWHPWLYETEQGNKTLCSDCDAVLGVDGSGSLVQPSNFGAAIVQVDSFLYL